VISPSWLALPILTSLLLSTATALANERPNIVLMMADDLGWGDPSYNGGWINTPTLDAMAASGLRFDRFYAASAVCSPTRGSCLTGRHPLRLGISNANSGRLGTDETPLSEVLDRVGYATGHFGKWHLGTPCYRHPRCSGAF
jgi:arylsulfatase A-like enzyme